MSREIIQDGAEVRLSVIGEAIGHLGTAAIAYLDS